MCSRHRPLDGADSGDLIRRWARLRDGADSGPYPTVAGRPWQPKAACPRPSGSGFGRPAVNATTVEPSAESAHAVHAASASAGGTTAALAEDEICDYTESVETMEHFFCVLPKGHTEPHGGYSESYRDAVKAWLRSSEVVDALSVAICREKHSGHDGTGCVYGRVDAEVLLKVALALRDAP